MRRSEPAGLSAALVIVPGFYAVGYTSRHMNAPTGLTLVNRYRCFDGWQQFFRHPSAATGCEMRFSLYLPPQAETERVPLLIYLAGPHLHRGDLRRSRRAPSGLRPSSASRCCPRTRARGQRACRATTRAGTSASAPASTSTRRRPPWSAHYRMGSYVAAGTAGARRARVPGRRRAHGTFRSLDGRARGADHRAQAPGALPHAVGLRADRGTDAMPLGTEGVLALSRRRPRDLAAVRRDRADERPRQRDGTSAAAHRPGPRRRIPRRHSSGRSCSRPPAATRVTR